MKEEAGLDEPIHKEDVNSPHSGTPSAELHPPSDVAPEHTEEDGVTARSLRD